MIKKIQYALLLSLTSLLSYASHSIEGSTTNGNDYTYNIKLFKYEYFDKNEKIVSKTKIENQQLLLGKDSMRIFVLTKKVEKENNNIISKFLAKNKNGKAKLSNQELVDSQFIPLKQPTLSQKLKITIPVKRVKKVNPQIQTDSIDQNSEDDGGSGKVTIELKEIDQFIRFITHINTLIPKDSSESDGINISPLSSQKKPKVREHPEVSTPNSVLDLPDSDNTKSLTIDKDKSEDQSLLKQKTKNQHEVEIDSKDLTDTNITNTPTLNSIEETTGDSKDQKEKDNTTSALQEQNLILHTKLFKNENSFSCLLKKLDQEAADNISQEETIVLINQKVDALQQENIKLKNKNTEPSNQYSKENVMISSLFALIIGSLITIVVTYLISFFRKKSKGFEEADIQSEKEEDEYHMEAA